MKVYELVEACDEPYESWDNGIGLYVSKEQADKEAESMNYGNDADSNISYYVAERELLE